MPYKDIPPLHIADYAVFAVSILLSLGIGIYHGFVGGQQKTTSEYFIGNKRMRILPVAMSLIVSFESSIMMLGLPAETFLYGYQLVWSPIGWFVSSIISAFIFVPMLHKVNLTSVFEYMEKRFDSTGVRLLGNILQTISYIVYMGIVLFGPALALEAVTGFPLYASIIATAVIAMVYTSVGGIKAVVWTDLFQCIVMISGILAILIKGSMVVGGVGEVIRRNKESGRMDTEFNPDPRIRMTVWTIFLASLIRFFNLAFNQASFQRISSTPTAQDAKTVYLVAAPGFLLFSGLACLEGLVAYAYFDYKGCDPLKSGRVSNSNQIMILLVLELFESTPGMAGLFFSALFSASLSTVSSCMGSVSANFWEDIVKPRIRPVSEATGTMIAKLAGCWSMARRFNCVGTVLGSGVISIAMSVLVAQIGGSMEAISVLLRGSVSAPLAGLQLLTALIPSVNAKGAIVSSTLSFILMCWLSFSKAFNKHLTPSQRYPPAPVDQCYHINMSELTHNISSLVNQTPIVTIPSIAIGQEDLGYKVLFALSPYLYSPLGVLFTIICAVIISPFFGTKEKDKVDEMFLTPYINYIWCCKSYRSKYIKKHVTYEEMRIIHTRGDTVITQKEDGHSMIEISVKPDKLETENATPELQQSSTIADAN